MDEWSQLLVSSLLHDLGKFWQRTGEPHSAGYAHFDEQTYGRHGAHAKWSADFIECMLPDWKPATWAVLTHHRPQVPLAALVALADRLSAGERDDEETLSQASSKQSLSIFSRLRLEEGEPPLAWLPLRPLRIEEGSVFPLAQPLAAPREQAAYQELWRGFEGEVRQIPSGLTFEARFQTLLALLQKYAWCVPSAYWGTVPDVSLYDHSRTTCALAAALSRSGISAAEVDALLAGTGDAWQAERLALVAGDITGVQRFIYTITAKGAARGLRGRSFYLQLLTEAIARWLLRELQLPSVNLLYAGGGRFYLLTHRLERGQLADLRRQLDHLLLQAHGGDLYVALAHMPLRFEQFERGQFREPWTQLHQELNVQKQRKFGSLEPAEQAALLFAPRGGGGEEQPCSVCRRDGEWASAEVDELHKCTLCASFEELGAELCKARWLFLRETAPVFPSQPARTYRDALRGLGLELVFVDDDTNLPQAVRGGPGLLLRLDETDFLVPPALEVARQHQSVALGFTFLANVVPLDRSVVEFARIATAAKGIERLGVLRLDVDDLGRVFGLGFGQRMTLSRVASLSSLLRLYFEGWLAELARRHNREGPHIYIVYAGGDDVFAVGSWDRIATLGQEIQRDFHRFTGGHPDLHLSAGIALVAEDYPLYQAAEEAREALEAAKARSENGRVVKNAVTFLGQTMGWDRFAQVAQQVEFLVQLIEREGVPRSVLQVLKVAARHYEEARAQASQHGRFRAGQLVYGRWMWLLAYALARLAERHERAAGELRSLELALREPASAESLGVISRWAELATRKEEGA
jgi:CRISPR-associated protein Csm1